MRTSQSKTDSDIQINRLQVTTQNIAKLALVPKAIYKSSETLIKILMTFITERGKLLKLTWEQKIEKVIITRKRNTGDNQMLDSNYTANPQKLNNVAPSYC